MKYLINDTEETKNKAETTWEKTYYRGGRGTKKWW
jgi:hypothetical protein